MTKTAITDRELEHLLALRRAYDAQKRRLEMAENALVELENSLLSQIEAGATVISRHAVQIKTVERRNVPWKSVCAEVIGAEATEAILANTPPSVSRRLLVKEAA
ncbi:MAG: hypothetical protein KF681_16000 [Bdellovibrionaceae bacterium]|nr:hypothetical protein [Pseudobdellovibrionaceae bacterium]